MNLKTWMICLLPFSLLWAQDRPDPLTLEQIMQDPVWMGEIPEDVAISPDGRDVFFSVSQAFPLPSRYKHVASSGGATTDLTAANRATALANNRYSFKGVRIDEVDGGLWLAQNAGPAKPLIVRSGEVRFVRFLDENRFVYRDGDQLQLFNLKDGSSLLLSALSLDEDTSAEATYLGKEERSLLKAVDNTYVLKDYTKAHNGEDREFGAFTKPKTAFLGKGFKFGGGEPRYGIDISDDLGTLAVALEPDAAESSTEVARFIDQEATMKPFKARPRVSVVTKTEKLVFVNVASAEVTTADISDLPGIDKDPLADIKAKLSKEDSAFLPKAIDDKNLRPVLFVPAGFRGDQFLVTVIAQDWKDLWMVLFNVKTGKKTLVFHHHDEAWVLYDTNQLTAAEYLPAKACWSKDAASVYFLSDRSGYQHLYRYSLASKELKQLTTGGFEVHHPFEGPEGKYWYFHSNKRHPGEYHFYRMPLAGGDWEQLTKEEGFHNVTLSGDGSTMVDLFSLANLPPILRVRTQTSDWKEIYDGRSPLFRSIDWKMPEILTYTNRDGKSVYARLYKPAKPNGAGVVFSHGAGYLQNAHKGWSGYYHEYMFHNLLLSQGYTVLDPDYQASAGYGRDWRTAIYRHMGGKDLNDILDGADFLVKNQGIDPARLGTYGGSYGGFLTLMALCTSPGTFQSGAALRSVSDWAHYNHWYTSRILNTPEVDPVAYRQSSPIYFAEGLKGSLLMCHGMVDDNVQYIDIVRLSQKFIELGKKDWTLASFPTEAHGFKTSVGWYDEYRRIKELFDTTLLSH